MLRRLLIPLASIVSAGAVWATMHREDLDLSMLGTWLGVRSELGTPAAIESSAMQVLTSARKSAGLTPLEVDLALQTWLHAELRRDPGDMAAILRHAQVEFPNFPRLAIISTRNFSSKGLQRDIGDWRDGLVTSQTHVAVAVQTGIAPLGLGCVMIVGEKLPSFSPEELEAHPHGTFYSICPHCGNGHACKIEKVTQCVSLQCPDCHRTYAMLAVDTRGRFRYVNEYLAHYQPPAHFPKNLQKLPEMLMIWQEVGRTCRYHVDAVNLDPTAGDDPTDTWQTAHETQCLQSGDCKDSSILLADWLMSRGFEARVAVGRYAERGGHAWVVTRVNHREYLLESTQPNPDITHLPLVTEVGSRYIPELVFDYDSIYVRQHPEEPFDGDYWSSEKWSRVVPRPRFTQPAEKAFVARSDFSKALAGAVTKSVP